MAPSSRRARVALLLLLVAPGGGAAPRCRARDGDAEGEAPTAAPVGRTGGLRWRALGVVAPPRRRVGTRGRTALLRPSSFHVEDGHVCGVIGPSGSGKVRRTAVGRPSPSRER